MIAILTLGFLLGMRHALEADHVAAVATLVAGGRSRRRALVEGAVWGLGHTTTLFVVCALVLFAGSGVPERVAEGLEAAVGAMLLLLGADLIRRLRRERVHFHAHRHRDGTVHFHAHSHAGGEPGHGSHEHAHPRHFPVRALCVGLMHGLAGSAALTVLTLSSMTSPWTGLLYVVLFGAGSVAGMALLSLAISVPLRIARGRTWLHGGIQAALGLAAVAVGARLLYAGALAAAL